MSLRPRSLSTSRPAAGRLRSPLALLLALAALGALACGGGDLAGRIDEIRGLQQAGEYEASIEVARTILAERPEHPEANYLLGIALAQTGRGSQAIWPLQKASQSEEYGVEAGLLLASTLSANRDYGEAVRAATRVLEKDPDRVMALYARAQAHVSNKDPEEALSDAERILQERPGDFRGLGIKLGALIDLERYDDAEALLPTIRQAAKETGQREYQARACAIEARFLGSYREEDRAVAAYEECLAEYPAHSMVLSSAIAFFRRHERTERAVEVRRKAVEERPDRLDLRIALAELLAAQKEHEEAESVYREAADLFDSVQAWKQLADFYRERERFADARSAIEKALQRSRQESPSLRFELADLLVAEGELERAEEMARGLERVAYRDLVLGRVRLAEGRPADALERFESGLAEWPNNAPARYYAGRAAEEIGEEERAVTHYRAALREEAGATDSGFALARLRFLQGSYPEAVQLAARHARQRGTNVQEGYSIAVRALTELGHFERARELATDLRETAGHEADGWLELANVERRAEGPAAAARTIAESGLDLTEPEHSDLLRTLVEDRLRSGEEDAALDAVARAREAHPEAAVFRALEGWTLLRLERPEDARGAFERARERDPELAWALAGLGELAASEGEVERALERFDRAAELDEESAASVYRGAQMAMRLGRTPEALERLERALERDPTHARAANDLAWLLAEQGRELERARTLAKRAADLEESATTLDTLGWVQLKAGDAEEAAETLERALELRPESASIRYRLGQALAETGEAERAQAMLRKALDAGSFPEAADARAALARLEEG